MNKRNRKSSNQDLDEDEQFYGMKKVTFWEIYGVKRFPYHGRRRHTPILQQHFDGRISITNDVFGLTIHQFEQAFKECLERRKKHSQWILNLRYPVKSSNEYLEYLENCIESHDEGYVFHSRNDITEKRLNEQLVNIVGTEIHIRHRQRLFVVHDRIANILSTQRKLRQMSSGSLSEGLNLPGSDIDMMYVIGYLEVLNDIEDIKYPIKNTTLLIEIDPIYPGFCRLKLVAVKYLNKLPLKHSIIETDEGLYLSSHVFIRNIQQKHHFGYMYIHGPCLSDKQQSVDFAFCLRCKSFPYIARQWIYRHRKQWPPYAVIDTIIKYGCLVVPIGPKTMTNNQLLWRLSFSVAEKELVHSFNYTQLLCYGLLKLTLQKIINNNYAVKDMLCSYFLKTTLFWLSEESSIEIFQLPNLVHCFSLCLDKLRPWIINCHCPNYFIPEQNMFLGKVNKSNNKILLGVVDTIICQGTAGLISCLSVKYSSFYGLASDVNNSTINLDFLLYKIIGNQFGNSRDIHDLHGVIVTVKSLLKSESSIYVRAVCSWWISRFSQYIAQKLPPPVTIQNIEIIRSCFRYIPLLQDGLQTDAVSGWLLYASYYYVTGQYNVTLRIADHVLSKCSSYMIQQGQLTYDFDTMNNYAKRVHTMAMTFSEKLKFWTKSYVRYLRRSSLIPTELFLEVDNNDINIHPIVLVHCLRFLCYHHLDEKMNKKQALRDACLSVEEMCTMPMYRSSPSITIIGVCFELSNDFDRACLFYDKALQTGDKLCETAEKRKSKLLKAKRKFYNGRLVV